MDDPRRSIFSAAIIRDKVRVLGVSVPANDAVVAMVHKIQEMTEYDAIVMGTPVYWFHVTAQFKMLVDRLYSFLEFKENPKTSLPTIDSAFPGGKRFIFVVSRGDPEPPAFFPQFYDHLNEWLNLIPFSLGARKYDFFHQYGADIDRKSASNDHALLKKAKAAGAGLFLSTEPSAGRQE